MIISVLLLYFFKRPFSKLVSMFPDSGNRTRIKFTYLVMKCMILCWLSILSSALALMLYLWRHIATLIEITLPFVCLCVVLMHIKYDDTFKWLCRPCIVCYGKTVDRGQNPIPIPDTQSATPTTTTDGEHPNEG